MRRISTAFFLLMLAGTFALAESTRLGIYMRGARIGEATYVVQEDSLEGKPVKRSDMSTTMSTGMLGTPLTIEMRSSTWTGADGKPLRMSMNTKSGGRSQTVKAVFGAETVEIEMDSGAGVQRKSLAIPKDGPVVDDPLPLVLEGGLNASKSFYVLRPDTLSFSKNTVVNKGASTVTVGGNSHSATLLEIVDPMMTTRVFVSAKGDLVKMEGPLGLELIPEPDGPVATPDGADAPKSDLAAASAIKPDKPLPNARHLRRLVLKVSGRDLGSIPSDAHQTATKVGDAWRLDIHPLRIGDSPGLTIAEAGPQAKNWLMPDTYIPADSPRFQALSRQIIGDSKRVREAAYKVQQHLAKSMKGNLGIGVLRDASEIWETKEGVCRDYAILAATLLRAGGIPTRLASGLVSWDGTFYYHAWVEVWDGKHWLGIDPTTPDRNLSASHVKLAQGTVADAFQFPLLDQVSIEVEDAQAE